MSKLRDLKQDISYHSSLLILAETYTDLASTRAQRIRHAVLVNRSFLEEISALYREVKANYQESQTLKESAKGQIGFLSKEARNMSKPIKNGKTALVIFTANLGLYGRLNSDLIDYFLQWYKLYKKPADIFATGRRGLLYLTEVAPELHPELLPFPDDSFDQKRFIEICSLLNNYSEVFVFFSKFQNLTSQTPTAQSLTGLASQSETVPAFIRYVFEPSLEEIIAFFEKEIFNSLFTQSIYEADLGKFAARIDNLDKAAGKVKDKMKTINRTLHLYRQQRLNKSQNEAVAGLMASNDYV